MNSKVNHRGKRKNEFSDSKNEPNLKALKKEDIIAHYTALQTKCNSLEIKILELEKKNKTLEEENRTDKEAIDLLEETVKILEIKANLSRIDKKTIEVQTDFPKLNRSTTQTYLCGDCDFAAECIHDFDEHTHSPDDFANLEPSLFTCRFCDESFETLSEVMKHNKTIHTSRVQHCKQFLENACFYGDNCWYIHSESFRKSEPSFKCNFCQEKFRTENILREHMKLQHIQFVSKCKNEIDCRFGPKKCWFIHKEDIEIAYENAK